MAGTVADIHPHFSQYSDTMGSRIGQLWSLWHEKRSQKLNEWTELRNYLFATDTSTTSNSTLPWKNKTTTPKLCQIRDNLHSNYISALFPNDRWFTWEGYTDDDEVQGKSQAIIAYMSNKIIEGNMRDTVSSLLYDYIDFGNAFSITEYEDNTFTNDEGETLTGFVGPKLVRISPLDIVFNPLAISFEKAPKIIRKILTFGELKQLTNSSEEWDIAFKKATTMRQYAQGIDKIERKKVEAFQVDGFGDYLSYLGSDYVEVLTFYGDYYDHVTGEGGDHQEIVIIDRAITVSKGKIKNWTGKSNIAHVGWRKRSDNLYAMGPLDNLVGMQYRLDHLENLKADAQDLAVHPMLKIKGDVNPFTWEPGGRIFLQEDGDVGEFGVGLAGVISANNEIEMLEAKMEEMAGAPKQAMGIRTPGEKTAFEVQSLENAAGRIFQEKTINFEINILEPSLNSMLADARKNLNGLDIARVMDDDLGVSAFLSITKDDITARGTLRPIGARHFAQQAQLLQNLNQLASGGLLPLIAPHISGKKLANLIQDALQITRFNVIRPNAAVAEQIETQKLIGAAQEQAQVEQSTPPPGIQQGANNNAQDNGS